MRRTRQHLRQQRDAIERAGKQPNDLILTLLEGLKSTELALNATLKDIAEQTAHIYPPVVNRRR